MVTPSQWSRTGRRASMVLAGGLLLLLPALALPQTSPARADSVSLVATADTYVSKSSPTASYGTASTLLVDNSPVRRSYLRFDATGVVGNVVGARLRVYNKKLHTAGFVVRPVLNVTWSEETTTWSNAPPLAAGAVSSGRRLRSGWVEVDVTSVLRWSGGLVSVGVTTPSSTGLTLYSRSSLHPPQLIVTTSAPSPSPSPSVSAEPSATPTATVSPSPSPTASAYVPPDRAEPLLAAAGDISCRPTDTTSPCQAGPVSDRLLAGQPNLVLALGDNQDPNGELSHYLQAYAATWGRLLSVTRPVPGDNEYQLDPAATGYYTYFGTAAGNPTEGWYSFDAGAWHVIALNSNCFFVGGCGAGSPQLDWLAADLQAHPAACTLASWHQPRWSSGLHGADTTYDGFWQVLQAAGVDVVLNAHDHDYERFARQLPDGTAGATGIRQFVVGTGGKSLRALTTTAANSEVRDATSFGALWLTLRADGYDWRFTSTAGIDVDSGSDTCTPPAP